MEHQRKPCPYKSAMSIPQERDHNLPTGRKLLVDHQRKRKRQLTIRAFRDVYLSVQRLPQEKFWEDSQDDAGFNPNSSKFYGLLHVMSRKAAMYSSPFCALNVPQSKVVGEISVKARVRTAFCFENCRSSGSAKQLLHRLCFRTSHSKIL